MDVKGYAVIKKDANCEFAMGSPEDWQGQVVRVMEFNDDSQSILVVNRMGVSMGAFDYKDMSNHFKCDVEGSILLPPGLPQSHKMLAAMKRMNRKGGYNDIIRDMVIHSSLHKNEFNDNFLFQKQ